MSRFSERLILRLCRRLMRFVSPRAQQRMRRARLLSASCSSPLVIGMIFMGLILSLPACTIQNLTLFGSGEAEQTPQEAAQPPSDEVAQQGVVCYWPLPEAAKAELRALGYSAANSPALHQWFIQQGDLRSKLPGCE